MKIDFERAVKLLKENDDILILSHASPDGDAIGSSFALMLALKKLGKRARVLNNDTYPEKFSFITTLPNKDEFEEKFIVTTDVADAVLLGKDIKEKYADKIDLAIDHHGSNKAYAKETYVEANSASACEIVYLIIEALGAEIDEEIASCLFTGVSTDTGCFRYSNVTPRTHIIAAKLIEYGAQHSKINTAMFETKKKSFLELQKLCLETMDILLDGRACVFVVTNKMKEETGCEDADLDAIAALSRQIEGVKVGVLIKEKADGTFKASVRTDEDVDAAKICSAFGGGGHMRAAGCSFECSEDEAKQQIVSVIKEQL